MLTTQQLLDAAKSAQGAKSDYRLARLIGIGDNALYNYRHGRTPDDSRAMRIAELAGIDPGYVLLCMAAERAKDDAQRAALTATAQLVGEMLGVKLPAGADGSDDPGTVPPADKLPRTEKPAGNVKTSMASKQNGDSVTSVAVEERNIVTSLAPSPLAFYASGWPRAALARLNRPGALHG